MTAIIHRGHAFLDFAEKVTYQKAILQAKLEEANQVCSKWQTYLFEVDEQEELLYKTFGIVEFDIEVQAQSICDKVNKIKLSNLQKVNDYKNECLQKLRERRQSISENKERINLEMNEYENILRSADVLLMLEFLPSDKSRSDFPPAISHTAIPIFRKGMLDTNQLGSIMGELDLEGVKSNENADSQTENPSKRDPRMVRTRPKSYPQSKTFVEWHAICTNCTSPSTVICKDDGEVWITTQEKTIQWVDSSCKLIEKRHVDFEFCDASLTTSGDLLFLNNKIYSVLLLSFNTEKAISTLFDLGLEPYSICSLHNSEIIISFRNDNKVMKYSRSGMFMADFSCLGLRCPWNVAQNKVNKHIYLIDKKGDKLYRDSGRVLACTVDGDFLYEYEGPSDSDFTPVDTCTDRQGQVYITDYVNNRVHILDKSGRFIGFLKLQDGVLEKPCKIDITDSLCLWISENLTRKIKVILLEDNSKQDKRRSDLASA
ncbi:hypothetical protein FSP39_025349 [Pinctada imbricata]|uniref:Tripartite motif-containing protein 2 n=1 Tax=Pinctada imbricata TaxID=66713 RepID=A0AA88YKQ1_PINIB|nr:hypothetical protein FSP39_025349 [Pinctada imbricata]